MPRLYSKSKIASNDAISTPFYSMFPREIRQILEDKFAFAYGVDRAGNFQVQFMPTPCDVAGNFKGTIGNASDKSNEPSFIFSDKDDSIGFVTIVTAHGDIPSIVRPKKSLPAEVLKDTAYDKPNEPLGLWTMPIMGLGPFQAQAPFGSILDDDDKARVEAISSDASSHIAFLELAYAQANENDVDAIMAKLKEDLDSFKDYVRTGYDELVHVSDPFVSFSIAAQSAWPAPVSKLRAFFKSNDTPPRQQQNQQQRQNNQGGRNEQQTPARGLFNMVGLNTPLVIQSAAELEHQSQAAEALLGLRLLFVKAFYSAGSKTARGYVLPNFSKGMQDVVNAPASTRPKKLQRLVMSGLQVKPDDAMSQLNPFYSERGFEVWPLNLAKAFLSNNFSQTKLLSLNSDSTSINYMMLGNQNRADELAVVRDREKKKDVDARYSSINADVQKHNSIDLDNLCKVDDMRQLPSYLANWNFLDELLFEKMSDGRVGIFTAMNNQVMVLQASDAFKKWNATNATKQPQLVFNILDLLSTMLTKFAKFSDHSLNLQEAELAEQEGRELAEDELELNNVKQALNQFARFLQDIEGRIADDVPIRDVAKVTPNDKNPDFLKMEELNLAVEQVAKAASRVSAAPSSGNKKKAESEPPSSPNNSKSNARPSKKAKGATATASKDYSKMGMFRTNLEGEQLLKWFKDLKLEKPTCPLFGTHGFACPSKPQNCEHGKHQPRFDKVYEPDQKKILEGARTTKKVWFDKSTFERHDIQLDKKYKFLLGDAKGPKST